MLTNAKWRGILLRNNNLSYGGIKITRNHTVIICVVYYILDEQICLGNRSPVMCGHLLQKTS